MNIISALKSLVNPSKKSFSLPWGTQSNSISKTQALNEYRRYIYPIVSAIAQDVARINFQVYSTNNLSRDIVPNHRFIQLMRNPNPDYTKFTHIELHQMYMELAGESFWYVVRVENTKIVKYINLLRPDRVDVACENKDGKNPLGLVTGYVFNTVDGKKIPFNKEDIIHFKYPNPNNPYRGISPIEASAEYVKTERLTSEFVMNSINNAGRPSGVLNIKGTIGEAEFEQVKKSFKYEYSGTSNAGKTMVVNGSEGVDFVKLGMELGELALKDLKDMTRDDLMMMYRVSKTMMGITDDVNRASAKEAKSVWAENVIKPKMERLCDTLDSFVAKEYGTQFDLAFEDPSPKYLEERTAEWSAGHNKWLTTNQIIKERNEFLGVEMEEQEGGDEIYQSVALVPMGTEALTDNKDDSNKDDKNNKKSCDCGHEHKKKELSRKEFGEVFRSELFTKQKQWQSKYKSGLNSILEEQKKEILSRNKKTFEEWTFEPSKYKSKYQKLFMALGTELMKEQALVALNAAGDSETIFEINARVLKYINDRINAFTTEFDTQTINEIKDSIGAGYQLGESISKLRNRINKVFGEAETTRSERVARTETIASSNEAALEAYRQSPMVGGQEWTTEAGACSFCQELNGKIVGLNTNFANIGESLTATDENGNTSSFIVDYMDIGHPPLHPNCECSILPVSRDAMTKMKINELSKKYDEIDKRTKESKELLEQIKSEKKNLETIKSEVEKEKKTLAKDKKTFLKDLSKKRNEERKEIFE